MKAVSELYGRHPGSDVYVVGTGASLRVFPPSFLEGRITIGLNMAWKVAPVRYGITAHPDLNVPEFLDGQEPRPEITWIVKREKLFGMPAEQVHHAEAHFHYFKTGPGDGRTRPSGDIPGRDDTARNLEWVRERTDHLYLWSSISQPAVNLAAHMGAKNIVLVGCDNAALMGNHHAHDQHTRWLGVEADQRYRDYYEGLAELRIALRAQGVNLVSMSPFLTLGPHEREFVELCDELGVPSFVDNPDITATYETPSQRYRRDHPKARRGPLRRLARNVKQAIRR